jgi:phosphoserine phosphatase
MNLILQGLRTERAIIDRIAGLADAQRVMEIAAHAYRCEGVTDSAPVRAIIDAACQHAQLDGTFINGDRKLSDFKLLVTDMDSTLITIECIDEIADMQGLKPQVAAITEAAMRGEIEFRESLTRRVALLKGLDASALQKVFDERLTLSHGAVALLAGVKAAGLKTVLISGGFTFFTERLQEQLGLDMSRANQLDIVDGKLTGKVIGEIVDAEEKRRTVERESAALGVPSSAAIVMGDGANDLQMMSVAGLSVAFRAKPVVRAQADVALNFVGLDGVLNLFA